MQVATPAEDAGCLSGLKGTVKNEIKVRVQFLDGQTEGLGEDLENVPHAAARFKKLNGIVARCHKVSAGAGSSAIVGTLEAMSFPHVGAQSAAYSAQLKDHGVNLGDDFVFFQVGNYIGDMTFDAIGTPDIDQLEAFVSEAINKVKGKPTKVPSADI